MSIPAEAESTHNSALPSDSRVCPFCSASFSRVDGAKRHAKRCNQRGGRVLPDRKRGRRTKACNECSRVKVHCASRLTGPCKRCVSRNLNCSFAHQHAETAAQRIPSDCQPRDTNGPKGRTSLSFLLNVTDDRQDFITERAIGSEPDGDLLGPTSLAAPQEDVSDHGILDFMDPSILLLFDHEPSSSTDGLHQYAAGIESSPAAETHTHLEDAILARHLEGLAMEIAANNESTAWGRSSLDQTTFWNLCSVSNVRKFVATFCRKRHYRYPIIHWPTFNIEEACFALTLVVALTGAAYMYGQGDAHLAVTARTFYGIADSYVFAQLEALWDQPLEQQNAHHAVQLCQAALLMYALDILPMGDRALQHAAVTKRLPTLICALRKLGFIQTRHATSEDWNLFIHREQIIRVVAWTYCTDCLATLSCNKPPGFSLLEVCGDLPCEPAIWESEPQLQLERNNSSAEGVPRCLKDLISLLISGECQASADDMFLPEFHLHMAICAIQQVIYNAHTTLILPRQCQLLLRILSTWRQLWRNAMSRLSEEDRSKLGVAQVVSDIEYLSRRIIEVAASDAACTSRYLQRVPSWGTDEVHEFIRSFVMNSG